MVDSICMTRIVSLFFLRLCFDISGLVNNSWWLGISDGDLDSAAAYESAYDFVAEVIMCKIFQDPQN